MLAADQGTVERGVERLEFVQRHFGQPGRQLDVDVAVLLHRDEIRGVLDRRQYHRELARVGDDVLDGLQLGHVVAGLVGHVQRQVVGAQAGRLVLGHGALHRALAPVVRGQRQVPVALHLEQLFQVVERGVGRGDRVAALVAPPVLLEVEMLAGGGNELPQARGLRARQGGGVVGAFDEGQQRQLGGQAAAVDFVDDEVQVLAGPLGHALHRLGVRRVVVGPLLGQVGVQVGDGEAAADAVPGVAGGAGEIDGAGGVLGDVAVAGGTGGLVLFCGAGAAGKYGEEQG
ncbi:Uncharacterised protein [Bordetella pertussis]|nr:Uncharacterised protein [Bordetella pertussis]CFL91949.1 Uncharacterised protein [Bordetella pertussis]CFM07640.1 Uncharacterised protein [Bordetella pertussis]CFM13749.1 Uncharacterised protein [Bordetella pertussis]CFM31736.1 Uncharacterised protein [Bordetella pertussis]